MTPLPPYEHLELRPRYSVMERTTGHVASSWRERDDALRAAVQEAHDGGEWAVVRFGASPADNDLIVTVTHSKPRPSRAVIGWLLVSLAVVGLSALAVWLFWQGFGT